ncbi:putative peptidase M24 [Rosa chinensis]|uniref:FACT complex subunit n=1 Tax=Rosa chinensis TaxID=74649 RepID=A0A2P6R737_ROSCH|nr:FACT complex subunit SPT16 [Rosa chinensis]XP_024191069.1 FACT complex subunit SPT16 [Rosa chinensis]XP_024191070.1 FACT complex subunit SPT16 [Rosa chinensis]PRQ42245.1 putative peptidase M24 [Rosa chinensis]
MASSWRDPFRTFLIDPNDLPSKACEVLYKAHEAAIKELKPGNKACTAYEAAVSVVKKEAPELSCKMTTNTRPGIIFALHESVLDLNGQNEQLVKEGEVFNMSLGFENLQYSKGKRISMWLADTVTVQSVIPEVLTAKCSKTNENIKLPLADNGGERQPEFMIFDDDDVETCKKRKRREMEDLEEAYSLQTQLDAKVNDIEALNIKLEEINAGREKNKSEDQEALTALHVHEKNINNRFKKMELARKAQSEFNELDVLFDEFDHL